jgi:hypothetical protein
MYSASHELYAPTTAPTKIQNDSVIKILDMSHLLCFSPNLSLILNTPFPSSTDVFLEDGDLSSILTSRMILPLGGALVVLSMAHDSPESPGVEGVCTAGVFYTNTLITH